MLQLPIFNGAATIEVDAELESMMIEGDAASGYAGESASRLVCGAMKALDESRRSGRRPSDPVRFSVYLQNPGLCTWSDRDVVLQKRPDSPVFVARLA